MTDELEVPEARPDGQGQTEEGLEVETDSDTAAGADPQGGAGDGAAEKARLIAESRRYRQRAQKAEALAREQAGRLEEITGRLKAEHAEAIAARDGRIGELTGLLERVVCSDRLKSALAARGVKKVDQAATLLAPRVRVTIEGGQATPAVLDEAGRPMLSEAGRPASIEALVEAWLADNGHFLPPSLDSGSGARRGACPERVTLADLDADPARKAEFIRRHGTRKYLALAGEARRTPGTL